MEEEKSSELGKKFEGMKMGVDWVDFYQNTLYACLKLSNRNIKINPFGYPFSLSAKMFSTFKWLPLKFIPLIGQTCFSKQSLWIKQK